MDEWVDEWMDVSMNGWVDQQRKRGITGVIFFD